MIALRSKTTGLSFNAGLGHEVIGLKVVGGRIESWLNVTKIFALSYSKIESNLAMVDYMVDMNDARVREAYDGIAASLVEIKTLKIANPLQSTEELTGKLVSDITPFETLYDIEKSKPVDQRAVDRRFKGQNNIDVGDRSSFRVAPIVMKLIKETEYFENALISTAADDSHEYFRLHTFRRTFENSWWASYYKAVSVSRASLLLESDKDRGIGKVRDIIFEWDYRDKALTKNELRMIRGAVRQALPESIYQKVNWGVFAKDRDHANARFLYKMVLDPQALAAIEGLGSGEIRQFLDSYILSIPAPAADPQDVFASSRDVTPFDTVADKYKESLAAIADYLAKVVDTDLTNEERSDAFAQLRFNDLFIEIGPGFLVSLLPPAQLDKLVYFEISFTADDVAPMPLFKF